MISGDEPETPARDSDWSAFLLDLQATIGNAEVVRLIENGGLLAVTSRPDDRYEVSDSGR